MDLWSSEEDAEVSPERPQKVDCSINSASVIFLDDDRPAGATEPQILYEDELAELRHTSTRLYYSAVKGLCSQTTKLLSWISRYYLHFLSVLRLSDTFHEKDVFQ